jgi:hypothetical protein
MDLWLKVALPDLLKLPAPDAFCSTTAKPGVDRGRQRHRLKKIHRSPEIRGHQAGLLTAHPVRGGLFICPAYLLQKVVT